MNPAIKIIAADPEGSVFSGGSGRPYLVEGVGEDFFPAAWDPSLYDDIIAISDEESFLTARHVSRDEGILIGGSRRHGRRRGDQGRQGRRPRRHRRRAQSRLRPRLPVAGVRRRLDGQLRVPHGVRPVRRGGARHPRQRRPSCSTSTRSRHVRRGDRPDAQPTGSASCRCARTPPVRRRRGVAARSTSST